MLAVAVPPPSEHIMSSAPSRSASIVSAMSSLPALSLTGFSRRMSMSSVSPLTTPATSPCEERFNDDDTYSYFSSDSDASSFQESVTCQNRPQAQSLSRRLTTRLRRGKHATQSAPTSPINARQLASTPSSSSPTAEPQGQPSITALPRRASTFPESTNSKSNASPKTSRVSLSWSKRRNANEQRKQSQSSRPAPKRQSSTYAYSQCGRHGNEWLFKGLDVKRVARWVGLLVKVPVNAVDTERTTGSDACAYRSNEDAEEGDVVRRGRPVMQTPATGGIMV